MQAGRFDNHHLMKAPNPPYFGNYNECGQDFIEIHLSVNPHSAFPTYCFKKDSIAYTTLEGRLSIGVGENRYVLSPQKKFTVIQGVRHTIINAGAAPATLKVSITPPNIKVEQGFKIWEGLDKDRLLDPNGLPKDFSTRCLLEIMTGMRRGGLLYRLCRILTLIQARRAEKSGLKEKLIRKYAMMDG